MLGAKPCAPRQPLAKTFYAKTDLNAKPSIWCQASLLGMLILTQHLGTTKRDSQPLLLIYYLSNRPYEFLLIKKETPTWGDITVQVNVTL